MSTKLFVGSLPWSIDDQKLKETFEPHGTIVSAKVVTDGRNIVVNEAKARD